MAILTFKDRRAEAILAGRHPGKGFPADLLRTARRKLVMVAEARSLDDLRAAPGNRLERLKGSRKGQHSIRLNDQFRIVFVWSGRDAEDVEIVDYH
ncbi:MAG: type II toxin-antitoxin system RelE/ParE family toxin [Bauldia sp.]